MNEKILEELGAFMTRQRFSNRDAQGVLSIVRKYSTPAPAKTEDGPIINKCRRCKGIGFFTIEEQDGSDGTIDCAYCGGTGVLYHKRPTPTPAVESLAELADRKGATVMMGKNDGVPQLDINVYEGRFKAFRADTYSAAENLARQYLNGLPDAKREG